MADTNSPELRASVKIPHDMRPAMDTEATKTQLLEAIQGLLRHCVTVDGVPDKGKGRTEEQQAAMDAARAAIAKATT
jgi:hypothetical protein